jgi:hypothetical protein
MEKVRKRGLQQGSNLHGSEIALTTKHGVFDNTGCRKHTPGKETRRKPDREHHHRIEMTIQNNHRDQKAIKRTTGK